MTSVAMPCKGRATSCGEGRCKGKATHRYAMQRHCSAPLGVAAQRNGMATLSNAKAKLGPAMHCKGIAWKGLAKLNAAMARQCTEARGKGRAKNCVAQQRKRPRPRGNAAEVNKKGFYVALIIGQKGNYVKFEGNSCASWLADSR